MIGVVFFWTAEGRFQEEDQSQERNPSFIKIRLLLRDIKKLDFPKRNIFSPQALRDEMSGLRNPREGVSFLQQSPQTEDRIESLSPDTTMNLRYIGFVKSGKKIIALVDFEGEETAVEEGDVISEGVTVGKITYQEIIIIGPDSRQMKFSLEGEKS
jgi:Tfp pilus assembly protein PilP